MREHLFLVIILLLSSCTITKRVHRKGVNIEWHKNYSTHQNSNSNSVSIDVLELEFSDKVGINAGDSIQFVSCIDSIHAEQTLTSVHYSLSSRKNKGIESRKKRVSKILAKAQLLQFDKSIKKIEKKPVNTVLYTDELLKKIGIIILIIGGGIILTSFIVMSGFVGFTNLFSSLVLSGNGFTAGVLGFLLFLLLVVVFLLFLFLIEAIGGFIIGLTLGLILLGVGGILLLLNLLLN